jgi:hypothetical protein
LIQEEIEGRLNSGNVCYHLAHKLLSSRLLSKNLKMRIYNIQEEHGLKVFENKVLRRIFAPKRDEVTGGCRKLKAEDRASAPGPILKFRRICCCCRELGHCYQLV